MNNTKKTKEAKNYLIRVRVTKEEHERFMERAHELGYRTVSDFVRTLINDDDDGSIIRAIIWGNASNYQ